MNLNKLSILCVEDDALQRQLIRDILLDQAIITEVDDGKKAIEEVRTHTFDVILMDLKLNGLNGVMASKYIRNTLKSNVPIIAITGNNPEQAKFEVKAAGCNDFLAKPYQIQELRDKIERISNIKLNFSETS